jgi:hypothetical protein
MFSVDGCGRSPSRMALRLQYVSYALILSLGIP